MKNPESRNTKLQALSKSFIESLAKRIDLIDGSRNEKNWQMMKDEIHKMKGVATLMGYPDITESAEKLEHEVIRENEVEVDRLLLELKTVCHDAKSAPPSL